MTESCPNVFIVDNAQFIDAESWEFFLDFVTGSTSALALAMRPLSSNSAQQQCEAAIRILDHDKTKRILLGKQ